MQCLAQREHLSSVCGVNSVCILPSPFLLCSGPTGAFRPLTTEKSLGSPLVCASPEPLGLTGAGTLRVTWASGSSSRCLPAGPLLGHERIGRGLGLTHSDAHLTSHFSPDFHQECQATRKTQMGRSLNLPCLISFALFLSLFFNFFPAVVGRAR